MAAEAMRTGWANLAVMLDGQLGWGVTRQTGM
jgi:hypothetical protein